MHTDIFIIIYIEGKFPKELIDSSNPDIPMKTNNKVPCKIKYGFGRKVIDEFIVLLSKT